MKRKRRAIWMAMGTAVLVAVLGAGTQALGLFSKPALVVPPMDPKTGWRMLERIEVERYSENGQMMFRKTYPEMLRAAADRFRIVGFYIPVEAEAERQSFLLVERPSDCPFCGTTNGIALEVEMREPLRDLPEFNKIAIEGRLEFNERPLALEVVRLVDGVRIATD